MICIYIKIYRLKSQRIRIHKELIVKDADKTTT